MEYTLDCNATLATVRAMLNAKEDTAITCVEQLEAAFWHLKSCASCRNSLSPMERGRFVCEVTLIRD